MINKTPERNLKDKTMLLLNQSKTSRAFNISRAALSMRIKRCKDSGSPLPGYYIQSGSHLMIDVESAEWKALIEKRNNRNIPHVNKGRVSNCRISRVKAQILSELSALEQLRIVLNAAECVLIRNYGIDEAEELRIKIEDEIKIQSPDCSKKI